MRPVPAASHQVSPGQGGQGGRHGGGEEGGRGGQAGGQHVRVTGPSQAVLGRAGWCQQEGGRGQGGVTGCPHTDSEIKGLLVRPRD